MPLMMRIPGVPARAVHDRVSLVDVAPTLARYLVRDAEMDEYHGDDLLAFLMNDHPARRLPLVMAGTSKEQLVRLAMIPAKGQYKLVLPFEGGVPELYDLAADDPDGVDVSRQHPRAMLHLLNDLVQAPMFPRVEPHHHGEHGTLQAHKWSQGTGSIAARASSISSSTVGSRSWSRAVLSAARASGPPSSPSAQAA